jgi:hypothetical protein
MCFLWFLQPFVSLVSVLCLKKFNVLLLPRENVVKISVCVSVLVVVVGCVCVCVRARARTCAIVVAAVSFCCLKSVKSCCLET